MSDFERDEDMEYLLALYASERAAIRSVHLARRHTGLCPRHLVESALTRSEELARESERFRRRWYPDASRVRVGGDRVVVETDHGRSVITPWCGVPPLIDEPGLRLVVSN